DALAVADAAIAVRHVSCALLMGDRDEANARRLEDVEGIHIGRAHDAKDMLHVVGDEGLDEGFARCHAGHGKSPSGLANWPFGGLRVRWNSKVSSGACRSITDKPTQSSVAYRGRLARGRARSGFSNAPAGRPWLSCLSTTCA